MIGIHPCSPELLSSAFQPGTSAALLFGESLSPLVAVAISSLTEHVVPNVDEECGPEWLKWVTIDFM